MSDSQKNSFEVGSEILIKSHITPLLLSSSLKSTKMLQSIEEKSRKSETELKTMIIGDSQAIQKVSILDDRGENFSQDPTEILDKAELIEMKIKEII